MSPRERSSPLFVFVLMLHFIIAALHIETTTPEVCRRELQKELICFNVAVVSYDIESRIGNFRMVDVGKRECDVPKWISQSNTHTHRRWRTIIFKIKQNIFNKIRKNENWRQWKLPLTDHRLQCDFRNFLLVFFSFRRIEYQLKFHPNFFRCRHCQRHRS